jgi:hypothetical protein
VAYDEDLANRIRELIAGEPDVSEETMFGGLVFLVGGKMSVAASGKGDLIVRVDPEETDVLLAKPHVQPFEMARAGDAGTVAHRRRGRANQTPARTLGGRLPGRTARAGAHVPNWFGEPSGDPALRRAVARP